MIVLAALLTTAIAGEPSLEPPRNATVDAVSGSSAPGAWVVDLQGGYPWSALRAQGGIAPRITLFGEVDTALFQRVQPTAGVHVQILEGRLGRLGAEAGFGLQAQFGELPQTGPSAVLRVRGSVTGGRVSGFLTVASRHTLLLDRTTYVRPTGRESVFDVRHAWTPSFQLGLGVRITEMVGMEAGLGWRFADVGTYAFSLPNFFLGVHVGGQP